jgi:putative transposase
MCERRRTDLMLTGKIAAIHRRSRDAYGSPSIHAELADDHGIRVGRKRVVAESFFASLECEVLNRRRFKSQAEVRMAIFEWIEGWYIPHRRHSGLGYRSPVNYERAHHQVRARMAELLPPSASGSMSDKISNAA